MAPIIELPELLGQLPLELRQCIYLHAALDSLDEHDLHIECTLSEDATDGSGRLEAPALDMLIVTVWALPITALVQVRMAHVRSSIYVAHSTSDSQFSAVPLLSHTVTLIKLKEVSMAMCEEAVKYLNSSQFTWILVSKLQPHMYLLRALRKSYPRAMLARISHVRVECASVTEHVCPVPSITFASHGIICDEEQLSHHRRAYVHHLGPRYDSETAYSSKLKRDFSYGLSLVPVAFPQFHESISSSIS